MARGESLSAFIARSLRDALTREETPPESPPFRLVTVGGDGPVPGVDLDRTSSLLEEDDIDLFGARRG